MLRSIEKFAVLELGFASRTSGTAEHARRFDANIEQSFVFRILGQQGLIINFFFSKSSIGLSRPYREVCISIIPKYDFCIAEIQARIFLSSDLTLPVVV